MTQIRANALDELSWRGLVALSTDEDALRASLAAGPVTYYCGFDPTAPSLHMGNLVQLLTMRRLQDFGHKPIALVGGATGLIGDPRMSGERVLNDHETVAPWVDRIRDQVQRFLSFDGDNAAVVVNNLDWTSPMSALDFLREVGKNFRVNRMLAKESVSARLNSEAGISFTEFSYQLLQGMDFYQLYRRYGCTLQTGGSDQWGNLTAGADLTHRVEGISLHALATPLITKADGTKFGKTEGGAIWLDPEMTSPYAFYQFWLNAEDSKVGDYLKIFTFRGQDEITALEETAKERPAQREAQRALAEDITTLVHGEETMGRVRAASQALFGSGDLTTLDASTLGDAVRELPSASISTGTHSVVDLFAATGLVDSKSAARRAVTEGGAYVNNLKVDTTEAVVDTTDLLHSRWILLRRGPKSLAAVEVG